MRSVKSLKVIKYNLLDLDLCVPISVGFTLLLFLLFQLPSLFASFSSTCYHWLWFKIGEQVLADSFDDPAPNEIDYHCHGKAEFERVFHFNNLEPPVHFGHEIHGTRESNSTGSDKTVPQSFVFADAFSEGSSLKIDCKRRDLLR